LITVALSTTIGASHERVWRALVDPEERPIWDERILGRVGAGDAAAPGSGRRRRTTSTADGEACPSQKDPLRLTRWRFLLGNVPLVMHDEVFAASPTERLVSRISIGSMHFDQTQTLHAEDDESGPRTRLGMKLVARNSIAVIGEVVPRLDVQKLVIEYVDTTLRQVQKHCETGA
jgi:hypothetical protein